jgi:hypothetical protein
MNIHDYLIDQAGKDWPALLEDWRLLLPRSFTLWLVNRFGDAFVVFDDESIHMLNVGIGQINRVADSRDQFADMLDIQANADDWLMIPLVDRCVASDMVVGSNQCYGYKIPPLLGGEYTIENIEPTDLSIHYSLLADIFRQTKDLPDGTAIKVVVVD